MFLTLSKRFMIYFCIFCIVFGCDTKILRKETPAPAKPNRGVPVVVAPVVQKTMPLQISNIGTVEAYSTVSIKPQVAALLKKVHFKEGEKVKKGDVLFSLDPRSFEASVKQAQANLAKNTINMQQMQKEAIRKLALLKKGIISPEEYDQTQSAASALEATVKADQAALEAAQLQLSYCTIYSPVDGRTSSILTHPGNLVKEKEAIMVVIHQIQPIYVTFLVPEEELAKIQEYSAQKKLPVQAFLPSSKGNPEMGILSFIDNTVDRNTGTIRLKATFENRKEKLWPGQFVNALLVLDLEKNSIVVPSQAVQTGQAGTFVFVVKENKTVEARPVVVLREWEGESVISQGLMAGEIVVIEGHLRLVPGSKVEIQEKKAGDKNTN